MATISIPLGTAARLWVTDDEFGVTLSVPPYWMQRLTREEAQRLAETLAGALGDGR